MIRPIRKKCHSKSKKHCVKWCLTPFMKHVLQTAGKFSRLLQPSILREEKIVTEYCSIKCTSFIGFTNQAATKSIDIIACKHLDNHDPYMIYIYRCLRRCGVNVQVKINGTMLQNIESWLAPSISQNHWLIDCKAEIVWGSKNNLVRYKCNVSVLHGADHSAKWSIHASAWVTPEITVILCINS